jgi:hypothetical protein
MESEREHKYEYRQFGFGGRGPETVANRTAKKGWRLVQVLNEKESIICEREVAPPPTEEEREE